MSRTIGSYKNYDRDFFLVDLSRVPFLMVYFFESLDDQVVAFNCLFLEVLDVYAPFKRVKINSRLNTPGIDHPRDQTVDENS